MFRDARSLTLSSIVVVSLSLTACSGDSHLATQSFGDEGVIDPVAPAPEVSLTSVWPLTGELRDGNLPSHPVYVVKIDNTSSSAPQAGLGSADMVVEELVEGGLTRLAAFFHEETPSVVGPVRSMRASDIGIVKPMSAVMVAAGAARPTMRRINAAGIASMGEDSPGFARVSDRTAPYDLFADLSEIAAEPGTKWDEPAHPYFPFGDETDFSDARDVSRLAVQFPGGHATDWTYADAQWSRPGSNAGSGDDFAADNVLVLRVREGDAGYLDPAGNPVPETLFVGSGDAVLISGEKALECRWSKAKKGSPLALETAAGKAVEVPPGHTFIELLPRDGSLRLER